jgi:hypothetical protein
MGAAPADSEYELVAQEETGNDAHDRMAGCFGVLDQHRGCGRSRSEHRPQRWQCVAHARSAADRHAQSEAAVRTSAGLISRNRICFPGCLMMESRSPTQSARLVNIVICALREILLRPSAAVPDFRGGARRPAGTHSLRAAGCKQRVEVRMRRIHCKREDRRHRLQLRLFVVPIWWGWPDRSTTVLLWPSRGVRRRRPVHQSSRRTGRRRQTAMLSASTSGDAAAAVAHGDRRFESTGRRQ